MLTTYFSPYPILILALPPAQRRSKPLEEFLQELCSQRGMSFPSEANPVEILLKPTILDMPRQGRNDIIARLWDSLDLSSSRPDLPIQNHRNPVYFVQASPGCGKTYLLREIGRMKADDMGEKADLRDTLKFLPINFNSYTTIQPSEKSSNLRLNTSFNLVFARVVHSMFVCDISFANLVLALYGCYGQELQSLMEPLRQLQAKYFPNKMFIALVDEISKVDKELPLFQNLHDNVRHDISTYCDDSVAYGAFFSCAVFSSLSMKVVKEANRVYSTSGRPLVLLGRLRMFSREETERLLEHYMRACNVCFYFENDAMVGESDRSEVLSRMATILHDITGGHPRSIDIFLGKFKNLTVSHRKKNIANLLDDVTSSPLLIAKPACIRAAVIGEPVGFDAIIPGSNPEITFDGAIEEGWLIGSNILEDIYVPFVSEVMLLKYIREKPASQLNSEARVKQILDRIMNCRVDFKPVSLENIVSLRERLISIFYAEDGTHGSVSVRDMFSKGINSLNYKSPVHTRQAMTRSDIVSAFNLKVDRNLELEPISFKSGQYTASDVSCGIFLPENSQNEGFDFVIRYPIASDPEAVDSAVEQQKFLEFFYQIKYSSSKASTKLDNNMIATCREACAKVARYPERFVFVMFAWREKYNNVSELSLPTDTVIYDKERVMQELGPTFSSFVDTLETSKIYFGSREI